VYVLIVGGGVVGYYLGKSLLHEGHEVLVIEKDSRKCERFADDLGGVCMRGDGCETATLTDAGAARADTFIAATDEDEDNLVASQLAKHKFNVPRIISLINNPKNEKIFKRLGLEHLVSVPDLLLEHITEGMPTHLLTHLLSLAKNNAVVELKVPARSTAIGKAMRQLELPSGAIAFLLIRESGETVVPTPDLKLAVGDRMIAVVSAEKEEELRKAVLGQ
jgi:trk system potassium uptake protein